MELQNLIEATGETPIYQANAVIKSIMGTNQKNLVYLFDPNPETVCNNLIAINNVIEDLIKDIRQL